MKRLLWKEWHELRWYLIAFVFVPWVVLSPVFTRPSERNTPAFDGQIQMLMLILLFWGASRMREEMQTHFPVSRLQMLAVKLLPGLILAVLFPCWIMFVAVHNGLSVGDSQAWLEYLAYPVSLYMVSFAFSLFASTIASVLATLFTFLAGMYLLPSLSHCRFDMDFAYWLLALTAFLTITGMCLVVRNADARRKAAVVIISIALTLPMGLMNNNPIHENAPGVSREASYNYNSNSHIQASPDRRQFAYAVSNGYLDEVKIRDAHGTRTIAERNCAAPSAWLPDGDLLIVASDTGLDTQLLEWNHESGALSNLVRFPNNNKSYRFIMPSIRRVIPSPDGTKIALFVESEKEYSRDLWMLDRKSHKLKLLHPGLNVDWYSKSQTVSWNGDRLIFIRGNRYWSIRSDGSDLNKIL